MVSSAPDRKGALRGHSAVKYKLVLKVKPYGLRAERIIDVTDACALDRYITQADALLDLDMPDCFWRALTVTAERLREPIWFKESNV
jgi:hypothetical protein